MARKQARRRKSPVKRAAPRMPKLPRLPLAGIAAAAIAVAAVAATYQLSALALDGPIRAMTIDAPFQRVSEVQIEEAVSPELGNGFLGADLDAMRAGLESLAWVDRAAVRRIWPDELHVAITEQVPAARWGESGLLNRRGELFLTDARHIPAELPRLAGPEGSAAQVASRYLAVRGPLIESGLDLVAVELDARGSWRLVLSNGVEVRLGRRDVDARLALFLGTVVGMVSAGEGEILYVDMRYSNGFTIGWTEAAWAGRQGEAQSTSELMAAGGAG